MRPTGLIPSAQARSTKPYRRRTGWRMLGLGAVCGVALVLSGGATSAQSPVSAGPSSDAPIAAAKPMKPQADLDVGGVLPYVDSFEDMLAGWDIDDGLGTVTTLSDAQFTREPVNDGRDIVTPDGARMAFLCSGPGERGNVNLGDLDGDPDDNSDNDRAIMHQTFTLSPTQVPATLSFDWNFLTAESDGTTSPDPFDDFFIVTLDGVPILSGSVPGGGPSPLQDIPVDGVRILQGNSGCSFEWGQSGFDTFQHLITTSGSHEVRFVVSDQGEDDFRIDTGLLIDDLRIEPEVDLMVTKTSFPDPAIAGEPLFYEITVTNLGSGRATDVEVIDTLPPQVNFISSNAPPTDDGMGGPVVDPACAETAPGSGIVECELGTLDGGETKVFTIQVDVDPEAVANGFERMTNHVAVSSFQVDADPSNNVFSQVAFLDDLADLRVWKVSKPDDSIRAGEIFTYTVLIENLGPSTAREVRFDDTVLFNSNVSLVNIILDPTRADSCTQAAAPPPQTGRIVRCILGESLEPVGSGIAPATGRWTVQIEARAVEATDVNNEVHVYTVDAVTGRTPGTPDPDLSNNYAVDNISVLDTSDLALTKTSTGQVRSAVNCALTTPTPGQVTAGLNLTYNLVVTNLAPAFGAPGGSTATNVVIEDFLPHGLELVSVNGVGPSGAAGCHAGTPGNPGDPTRCTYGSLAVAQTASMTIVVRVDDDYVGVSGTNLLQNSAQAFSDNLDPSLQNNWVNQVTTVGEVADVSITKSASPNPVNAGESLTYELVVQNSGPSTAREVIIRDRLPAGVVFHSARIENLQGREKCTYSTGAHEVICSGFDIPPSEPTSGIGQRRVFINTRVRPDTAPGAIGNTATATTTQTPDCNVANNSVTITTSVVAIADLEILKTSSPVKVFAGEQKKYTITVTNLGPSYAQNVEVYDVLPDEVNYEIDTNAPMCTRPANLLGYRAVLAGANEVPPNASLANGLATFVLDTTTNRLVYSLQVNDVDNLLDAHIHAGGAGVNGPVVINLFNQPPPPPFSTTNPVVGELFLSAAQAAALIANPAGFYVNVHSTDFPGGEMRGQVALTRTSPLLCPLGTLEPRGSNPPRDAADSGGGVRTFDIWTLVRPEIYSGTTITNVAIVTSPTEPDRDLNPIAGVTNSDVYTLGRNNVSARKNLVLTKSDLKVTKFGNNDGQVRAGQILTYTVIVDNLGPSFAETVSLKDVLQSGEQFDLIDITSDRATTCRSLTAVGTETNNIAGTPWPPSLPPVPFFGVLEPTGIPLINQRLQVDCTLTQGDNPLTPRNEAQLAVLRADGPPNSGRWILTMRVRFRQAQDIRNVADVLSATAEEPQPDNNHAEVLHEITDVANLSIVKTAVGEVQVTGQPGLIYNTTTAAPAFPQAPNYTTSATLATAGRRIRYTLRIQNGGPSDAENVIVTDRLPPGVTILPGSVIVTVDNQPTMPAGTCETGTPGDPADRLVCGLGTLLGVDFAVRRGATIQYDVLVDPSLAAGSVLENDAFVSSDVFDPFNQNNHTHVETVVDTDADLSTSKTAMGQNVVGYDVANQRFNLQDQANFVTAGLVLRYEIAVQNNGPSDSSNVTLSDVLPAGVRLLRVVGASCRPTEVGGTTLYCTVGDLPVGARRTFDIYVTVDQAVANNTVIQNCVTSLSLGATPPAQPPALPPPAPTLPLTDDPFSPNNQACNNTTVRAVADVGGPDTGPATSGALSFIEKKDVPAEPRLDMPLEPDLAVAGLEHRYRIRFGNAGPSTAVSVVLTDTLDFKQPGLPGERFVRCEPLDPDDAVICTYNAVTNVVTLANLRAHNEVIFSGGLGTLAPGITYGFDLITLVDPGYILDASNTLAANLLNSEPGAIARNTVFIRSTTTDFRLGNNRDTERTRIIAEADLSVTKTDLFGDDFLQCDPVTRGGMITWTIRVRNDGPSDAAEVFAVDRLPEAFVAVDPAQVDVTISAGSIVEVRDDGRITLQVGNGVNNAGVPELGRLNAGQEVIITIQAMVRQTAACGGFAVNLVTVETRRNDVRWPPIVTGPPQGAPPVSPTEPRTPTFDPDANNNLDFEDTKIECPAIEINKTVSFDGKCPGRDVPQINRTGQPVTFCFEIKNTGTTYLDDIFVEDTLRTRTTMPTVIFTDTIKFGVDPKVPVAPGETVLRQVTYQSLDCECGIVEDIVTVTANPVNSGRTDLTCLPNVTDSDIATIEVPCAGVDFRLQLPVLHSGECETWVTVQNVGDRSIVPLMVVWGDPGFCPPQAAGPLKAECGGLLRPGSAWRFAAGQVPTGSRSAVVYAMSAETVEVQPGTKVPFGALVCEDINLYVVGRDLEWVRFDAAYRMRGLWRTYDFGKYLSEPVAVVVNRTCPDVTDPNQKVSAAYIGISSDLEGAADPRSGGHGFYAPLVFANKGGLSSMIHMQNSGALCSSLEIWFYGQDNCMRPMLGDVLTLSPGETVSFDPNTVVGPDWLGSAWIRSTVPLGVVVDTNGANHFTSYNGYPADVFELDFSFGNQINYAPLTYSEYQGWDSAIQVQNLSGTTAAKVKVYFLDRAGGIITTLVDWICPRGSQTFFLPVIGGLPGAWVGSARIESQEWITPGGPNVEPPKVLSVVLLEKWADPARTARREAIAYNAQTECYSYDWQLGSGKGGTASGSAVFAIPLVAKGYNGVTSEIAITNLVPKPGFTDFVIYLYDQNGRIDHFCEKLTEKQVEYLDLNTIGWIPPRYMGSMVVSAVFWEHDVFDGQGRFVRNLVGLGAVSVERIGGVLGGNDVPGDESKAFEAFPIFDHFEPETAPNCPGVPVFQPLGAR